MPVCELFLSGRELEYVTGVPQDKLEFRLEQADLGIRKKIYSLLRCFRNKNN